MYISIVLLLDQALKLWIKTHFYLGQEFRITDWFIIHFTENNGMAFGYELGGKWGKLILSTFRIIAVIFIGYYVLKLPSVNPPIGLILAGSFIFAGAVGNILDSMFYGLIFSDSYGKVAEIFPSGGGYAPFLFGKVVDMLYFPLYEGFLPEWIPIWGGEFFIFFQPVFNIADAAISTGIGLLLLNHKKYFHYLELIRKNPSNTPKS